MCGTDIVVFPNIREYLLNEPTLQYGINKVDGAGTFLGQEYV